MSSATSSGIAPSKELVAAFAEAVELGTTRFIKVSIRNEALVNDASIPVNGTFADDLPALQDESLLDDTTPAYILAKLDDQAGWIAFSFVPDNAKVRDKMLYASTRASLLKTLGSNLFTDSIFATSKADLTAEAYGAHQRHIAAPKPLSAREQELSDLKIAESATGGEYAGSRARVNHVGTGIGLKWSAEAEQAVVDLAEKTETMAVVLTIDTSAETLVLHSQGPASTSSIATVLPGSEPCFALFSWLPSSRRQIVFLYSCPSSSPIKYRMIYSSSSTSAYQTAKKIISAVSPDVSLAGRKLETSDPKEVDEAFISAELGCETSAASAPAPKQAFARPRGPGRRR